MIWWHRFWHRVYQDWWLEEETWGESEHGCWVCSCGKEWK